MDEQALAIRARKPGPHGLNQQPFDSPLTAGRRAEGVPTHVRVDLDPPRLMHLFRLWSAATWSGADEVSEYWKDGFALLPAALSGDTDHVLRYCKVTVHRDGEVSFNFVMTRDGVELWTEKTFDLRVLEARPT